MKSEGNRINFKLEGEWKFYSDSGIISSLYQYTAGIKNGVQKIFYPDGTLQNEETDSMGVKNGLQKFYNEEGKLVKVIPFVSGVEHGMAKEYNANGTLITVTSYRNGYFQKEEKINRVDKLGMKQGIYRAYYDNDSPKSEGSYKDDKKDGTFKEYSPDGRVVSKEEYRNGELIVTQKKEEDKFEVKRQYYNSGVTKIVGTYKKGVPEGTFRQYDENGNLEGAKVYKAGRVLREGKYDGQGREQGEWKEFYESGHQKSKIGRAHV